ncbi:MAG: hypothetical protein HXL14_01280 [Parvimonas sp.]|nr:hypothetical protein [Parvimonas sp.]
MKKLKILLIAVICFALIGCKQKNPSMDASNTENKNDGKMTESKKTLIFEDEYVLDVGGNDGVEFHRLEGNKLYISMETKSMESATSLFTNSFGYIDLDDGTYHELKSFGSDNIRVWDYVYDDGTFLYSTFDGEYSRVYLEKDGELTLVEENKNDALMKIPVFRKYKHQAYYLSYSNQSGEMYTSLREIDLASGEGITINSNRSEEKQIPDYLLEMSENHLTYSIVSDKKDVIYDWDIIERKMKTVLTDISVGRVLWSKGNEYICSDNRTSTSKILDESGSVKYELNYCFNVNSSVGNGIYHFKGKIAYRYSMGEMTNLDYADFKLKGEIFPNIYNVEDYVYICDFSFSKPTIWVSKFKVEE